MALSSITFGATAQVADYSEVSLRTFLAAPVNGVYSASSAQFNSAFSALGNKGRVKIPCGTYNLAGAVWVPLSVEIVGAQRDCVVIRPTAGTTSAFHLFPTSTQPPDISRTRSIKSLTIDGSASPGAVAILIGSTKEASVEDVSIKGFSTGVGVELRNSVAYNVLATEGTTLRRVWFNNNKRAIFFNRESLQNTDPSFGYTRLSDVWIDVSGADQQIGIDVSAGAYVYNSHFSFMCGYLPSTPNSLCIRSSGNMDRNFYAVTGETQQTCTKAFVAKDANGNELAVNPGTCPWAVALSPGAQVKGWGHIDIADGSVPVYLSSQANPPYSVRP